MTSQNPDEAKAVANAAAASQFYNLHEVVRKARANLNQNDWDYIVGGTETETTLRRNRMALDSIALRPRVLRDVSKVDPSVEVLGRKLRLPVVLCPVGSLESFHPRGAEPVVRAAAEFGVAHMLSSVCEPGLEEVAKAAPDALRMFQLYVRGDADWADDHVERAIKNNYAAFCITVDTAHYSRRERDLAKRHVTAGRRRVQGRDFQTALDWRTVERMKSKFKIPFAIKGISTAEDAKIALDHGVEIIYVSNHGGRQLDHGRGSAEVLPEVVEAVAGRALIIVDGAINRGTDIVKALCMGAKGVAVGRPYLWGLGAFGEAGVTRVLELLRTELLAAMQQVGAPSLKELVPAMVRRA
jgi:glycolate oxidase